MSPDILSLNERREIISRSLKMIPLGYNSFADLRASQYTLVDKSKFVSLVLQSPGRCNVFLRPRRFGKSLNASMLHCFLSNQIDTATRLAMFEGLSVLDDKEVCYKHMGKYAVVHIDFHDCCDTSWESLRMKLVQVIATTLLNQPRRVVDCVLRKSTVQKGEMEDRVAGMPEENLGGILLSLAMALVKFEKSRMYLIVDEYDTPFSCKMASAEDDDTRGRFFSNFYTVVRHSDFVEKGCFIGITDIRSQHPALSKFNYFNVYGIMDGAFDNCFGLEKYEVVDILKKLGLPVATAMDEWKRAGGIKCWYNGYRIGTRRIINPWSFFRYLSSGLQPTSYWVDSAGGLSLLTTVVQNAQLQEKLVPWLKYLLDESRCKMTVNERFSLGVNPLTRNVLTRGSLCDALCCQGYLTTKRVPGSDYGRQVWIPNKELRGEWIMVLQMLSGFETTSAVVQYYSGVIRAFEHFDEAGIKKILERAFSRLSARITHKEYVYHLFIAGILSVLDEAKLCRMLSETGAGNGYADLLMSFEKSYKTVIIEFKRAKAKPERLAQDGLLQIFEKNYIASVPASHSILAIGCAVDAGNRISMKSHVLAQGDSRDCNDIIERLKESHPHDPKRVKTT